MQRRQLLRLSGAGLLSAPALARAAAPMAAPVPAPVDVELVLAVDVSRSIDAEEHETQMRGYAAAFRDRDVLASILGGEIGAIGCTLFTWSDADCQEDLVGWTRIGSAAEAARFADALDAAPRRTWSYTSISGAMEHALRLYARSPFEATRRVLDISGDGMNNSGRRVDGVRADVLEAGIVLNGLAILDRATTPDNAGALEAYYREAVIGGPGAFLVVADGFGAFDRAVRRKIAREVAAAHSPARFATAPYTERATA